MLQRSIAIIFVLCALAACDTVPQNGSTLNEYVSEGMRAQQLEVEKVILALGDVQRAILDEKWDDIYANTESRYMADINMTDPTQLSHDDRRKIAATAAVVMITIGEEIDAKQQELISQSRANTQQLLNANDSVTRYLSSVETLEEARRKVIDEIGAIVGIDPNELTTLVKQKLGGA